MILLSGQILVETHQSGHAMGGDNNLGIFCMKCLQAWLRIFHFTFSNQLVVFLNDHFRHYAQD
jgi:hypothetical protein